MLTLTPNARHAVRDIAARAHLSRRGGLRIAESRERAGAFEVSLVEEPVEGDEVIEADGARVYVEPRTSSVLADQQLDAAASPEGTGFLLAPRD
ncbi:adhesin [Actinotalea solisilvae]|uniref:adhesin n=1 Tax=Actinotalea solisilvae TaxID=2072922 RepID=UPI0018F11EC4|nr:adhesin [Actinotalea solisilvae]